MDSKLFKFLVTGGSAAFAEYSVFVTLIHVFLVDVVIYAHIASFLCGFVISFTLNKIWVFQSRGDAQKQFLKYLLLAVVNLAISAVILWALVDFIKLDALLAKLLTMAAIAVSNYFIFSKLIFKIK